jgi:GT2 family glycosyltransferase
VDNNSVDGSVEMVQSKFPDVVLIANKDNRGFSRANNQAIDMAKGEYILLLNPDTVVEEDTFEKCIRFMETHLDAGGLGVNMIDGAGNFLPESKRGLPRPAVAFYKIFGLSVLFPKSKVFGKYHLGYLDRDQSHEVDVLSGAFMLLSRKALNRMAEMEGKTEVLDETFFMYGEDIDLSYRIQKAGFKNYYFADTKIIHYKGESTRKSSINYVFVFYKAMVIFAEKHFSQKNAKLFSFLIHLAIWMRAGLAILVRFIKRLLVPALDASLFYGGMYALKSYWESHVKSFEGIHYYPAEYVRIIVPLYVLAWIGSIFLSGGYDRPWKPTKLIRGIFAATILILVIYALLPETMRFSRALIILGTIWSMLAAISWRTLLSIIGFKRFLSADNRKKKIAIVGDEVEGGRVQGLLTSSKISADVLGLIYPNTERLSSKSKFLGSIDQLDEIIHVFRPDEIIFCSRNISASQIIDLMASLKYPGIEFKIAPEESQFIIGSSSVNDPGDLYVIDINSIHLPVNRRNKRVFDILIGLACLPALPILLFIASTPRGLLNNIFTVLFGKKTWVAYTIKNEKMPVMKRGVLRPADSLSIRVDEQTEQRLNLQYARDYSVYNDLRIISKAIRKLGNAE